MAKPMRALTDLLQDSTLGDAEARELLWTEVYPCLRRIAQTCLKNGRHTLRPTALIGEAFVRLEEGRKSHWKNRQHFFAVAAMVMRHIVVDHVRKNCTAKRGGKNVVVPFNEDSHCTEDSDAQLLALDEALEKLKIKEPRLAEIVVLRYFGGLDLEETAAALDISVSTAKRDWTAAKLWLRRHLTKEN